MKFILTLLLFSTIAFTQTLTVSPTGGGLSSETNSQFLTALGASTVGQNVITLSNPSAVAFLRLNEDNTVSSLNASDFRGAIGAGTSSLTLTDSASLAATISDETGTGFLVFSTSPALTTPTINVSSDAEGDIYYRSSGGSLARLGVGTNGQVLTLSTGLPSWADAAGGGLDNFTETFNNSAPNATKTVASLNVSGVAANMDIVISPKGTGAILRQIPDNTTAGGNKRGNFATDFQHVRVSASQVASGADSFAVGRSGTASGDRSAVIGGEGNIAAGANSVVLGTNNSTAHSSTAVVLGGAGGNNAYGPSAIIASNGSTTAGAQGFSVILGSTNSSTNNGGNTIIGGESSTAESQSIVMGPFATDRGRYGSRAWASGRFAVTGDALTREFLFRGTTTTNTISEIATATSIGAGVAQTRLVVPNNHIIKFRGQASSREAATGDVKTWDFSGTIKRGANAASTSIVGSPTIDVQAEDVGAGTWTLSIDADTTNGSLRFQGTGENDKTIRWLIHVETVELG